MPVQASASPAPDGVQSPPGMPFGGAVSETHAIQEAWGAMVMGAIWQFGAGKPELFCS